MGKPTIDQILESLNREVMVGRAYLTIAKGLEQADRVVFDTAPAFFGLTHEASLSMSQMCAAKMYDKTKGTVTVDFLLAEAESKRGAFKDRDASKVCSVARNAETRIARLETVLTSIRTRRNEAIAHLDPATVMDPAGLAQRAKLSVAELEQVFATTDTILNEMQVLWSGTFSSLKFTNADDFVQALQYIADAKHDQAIEYEAKIKEPSPYPRPKIPRSPPL